MSESLMDAASSVPGARGAPLRPNNSEKIAGLTQCAPTTKQLRVDSDLRLSTFDKLLTGASLPPSEEDYVTTSTYNYHPFHSIGAAKLLLWDAAALSGDGAWRSLGRVADCAVLVSGSQVEKDIAVRGLSQPIAKRPRSRRYSLSFRLLELSGPEAQALLFGDGGAQERSASGIEVYAEALRLYGYEQYELAHPYGLVQELPAGVSSLSTSVGGGSGVIPATNYHYWVVPYLGHGDTRFLCTAVHTGPVTVGSGQQVTFTFTAPTDYAPDGYRIYYNSSNNLASAVLARETSSGSPIVISSHAGSPGYSASELPFFKLLEYDGGGEFAATEDYALAAERGLVSRSSGSSLPSGSSCAALYAYWQSAAVSTALGDAIAPERYRRIKLLQLMPEDPEQQGLGPGELDPAAWRETGVELELYKVALTPADTRWPFAEAEFGEGASLLWDCMFDGGAGAVGTVRSSFSVLAQWD
jgi:hypothetical protein